MKTLRALAVSTLFLPFIALGADASAAAACSPAAAPEPDCDHPPAPAVAPEATQAKTVTRGEKLRGASPVALKELLSSPATHAGKTVALEGRVRKACERRGCWMELADTVDQPGVRVTLKGYAFFVPVDSAGAHARVEGVVRVAELSEARARHYENEGAVVPRGADGKPREVQLEATGVELRR